ncbi:MAG: hypothetical protein M3Y08_06265 [Fibrobacterota bacterium]|nr:hypothetical protein [Fibrobacterota bacterium]
MIPVSLAADGAAGVMARTSNSVDAPFVAVLLDANGRCFWRYRATSGSNWAEIPLSDGPVRGLGLGRVAGVFYARMKLGATSEWQAMPTALDLPFPEVLGLSLVVLSASPAAQDIRFTGLSGFLPPPVNSRPCLVFDYPFNDGRSPGNLLFSPLRQVQLKMGETFLRTTSPGGAWQSSLLGVPMSTLPVVSDTQQIRFRVRADRDAAPALRAYLVYGKEGVELRDRAKVRTGPIISGAGIIIGNDAVSTGSLEAKGSLTLRDRARVEGDVIVGQSILRGNATVITGTVRTGTAVAMPALPETTWTSGTTNVTVNPDQTKDLAPGVYGTVTVYSRANLHFQPGVYRFASLWIDTDVKWHIHNTAFAGVEVFANTTFRMGDRDQIVPYDTSGGPILRVYSNQIGEMRMGTDMKLNGEFILPKANVIMPSRTISLRGGLYARTVTLEPDAQVVGAVDGIMTDTLRLTLQGASGSPFVLEQLVSGGRSSMRDKLRIKPPGGTWTEKSLAAVSTSGVWQTWDMRLVPAAKGRGYQWQHDAGGGLQPAFSGSGAIGGDTLKSVTLEYLAQPARLNRQISLDDIHVGCLNPACPSLVVTAQPLDTTLWQGGDARFEVKTAATGVGYQWYLNGSVLPNESSSRLNVRDVTPAQNGHRYRCRIRSNCDSAWSREATLTVRACGTVSIWAQPQSQVVREGGEARFKVNAGGVGQFKYTWYRNGLAMENQTLDSLSIRPIGLNDHDAEFRVKVSDGCGRFELSELARLKVQADSGCHGLAITGPDTLRSGKAGAYEGKAHCPGGAGHYSVDAGPWRPLSRGGVAIMGPFTLDGNKSAVHQLRVVWTNVFANDTVHKSVVVVPGKPSAQTVAISGLLKNANGAVQDGLFQFEAQLFDREGGGRCLYRESFSHSMVPVIEGEYTLSLGSGEGGDSLAAVLREHPHVFVSLQAGRYGVLEPIVDKLPLTAAPFVLRSQP